MIVECSNCQTRFQLDESRVPVRGIRVRCSRCKEAFFLPNPNASEAEAVDDVADQAISGESPEPTQDLPPESSPALAEPEEEADWEFNQDLPDEDLDEASGTEFGDPDSSSFALEAEEPEEPEEQTVATLADPEPVPGLGIDDGSLGDGELDEGSGLDLAADPAPEVGGAEEEHEEEPEEEEDIGFDADEEASDFGEASDFSALSDDTLEDGDAVVEEAAPASAPELPAPVVAVEDVGEPEDWDFFSDESLEAPSSMEPMDHAMGRAMATIEADSVPQDTEPVPELRALSADSRTTLGALRGAGRMLGWLVTLGLFGVGIARGVFQVGLPVPQMAPVVDLGALQAQEIRATWLETTRSNRLYAVEGRLVNEGGRAVLAGSGTQVALLTVQGDRLELPAALAGVPLSDGELRELSPAALREAAARSAAQLAATRLEPGQAADFQAFFDEVPEEATRFLVEMTESAPVAPAVVREPLLAPEAEAALGTTLEATPETARTTPSSAAGVALDPRAPTNLR